MFAKILAEKLRGSKIRVYSIDPGGMTQSNPSRKLMISDANTLSLTQLSGLAYNAISMPT